MSEKKQVLKNLLINVFAIASQILVGLWLTPYLVGHLGTAAYGFVPMAYMLAEYIVAITNSINAAISRFLTINIQEENWVEGNITFNTALLSNVTLTAVQIPVLLLILLNLSGIFTIPEELKSDVFYLMLFSGLSFVSNVAFSVFTTSMFAKNRLDVLRGIDTFIIYTRTAIIILCFTIDTPRLYYATLAHLIASIVANIIRVWYWRKLTPQLRINPSLFNGEKLKSILNMSLWLLVGWFGFLLFMRSELLVANRFLGAVEAGQYAVVEQWRNVVISVVFALSTLTSPLILAAYAKKNFEHLQYVMLMTMKLIGIFMSVVSGVIIVQSKNLLMVWVGPEFARISVLLVLFVVHLPVCLAAQSLYRIFEAYNRVKFPALMTLVCGALNVGLAVILVTYTSLSIYAVALAGMLMTIVNDVIIHPIYAAIVMKVKLRTFFVPLGKSLLSTFVVILAASPILFFNIDSWAKIIFSSAVACLFVLPLIWLLILNKEERKFLTGLFPENIRTKISFLGK